MTRATPSLLIYQISVDHLLEGGKHPAPADASSVDPYAFHPFPNTSSTPCKLPSGPAPSPPDEPPPPPPAGGAPPGAGVVAVPVAAAPPVIMSYSLRDLLRLYAGEA